MKLSVFFGVAICLVLAVSTGYQTGGIGPRNAAFADEPWFIEHDCVEEPSICTGTEVACTGTAPCPPQSILFFENRDAYFCVSDQPHVKCRAVAGDLSDACKFTQGCIVNSAGVCVNDGPPSYTIGQCESDAA